jgi:hypothetical protein
MDLPYGLVSDEHKRSAAAYNAANGGAETPTRVPA